MKVLINYLDELIDKVLNESANIRKDRIISPQELLSDAHRLSSPHAKGKNELLPRYLVRYIVIYYVLSKIEDTRSLSAYLLAIQNIQEELYLTPVIVSETLQTHVLLKKILRYFESGRSDKEIQEFMEGVEKLFPILKKEAKDGGDVHNLVKLLIFRKIYTVNDKWQLQSIVETQESHDDEYTYITILEAPPTRINHELLERLGVVEDADDFLEMTAFTSELTIQDEVSAYLDFLFEHQFLIPVTHDFSRYHDSSFQSGNNNNNKLSTVLSTIHTARNFPLANQNKLWYPSRKDLFYIGYNFFNETRMLERVLDQNNRVRATSDDFIGYQELMSYRFQNNFDFLNHPIPYTTSQQLVTLRSANILYPPKYSFDLRHVRSNTEVNLFGVVIVGKQGISRKAIPIEHIGVKDAVDRATVLWRNNTSADKVFFLPFSEATGIADTIKLLHNTALATIQTQIDRYLRASNALSKRYRIPQLYGTMTDRDWISLLIHHEPPPSSKAENIARSMMKPIDFGDRPRTKNSGGTRCIHYFKPADSFSFIQKYAVSDTDGNIICRSCGEGLGGTLFRLGDVGLDDGGEYVLTSVANNSLVHERKVNANITRMLVDLDRFIRLRLARILQSHQMMSEDREGLLRRNAVISDTIDLIRSQQNSPVVSKDFSLVIPLELEEGMFSHMSNPYKVDRLNLLILYTTVIMILNMSETEIIKLTQSPVKGCAVGFFTKNRAFFESIRLSETSSLASLPVLCFILTQTTCLLHHYNAFIDKEGNRPLALKKILITLSDILIRIITKDSTQAEVIERVLTGRFRLSKSTLFSNDKLLSRILAKPLPSSPTKRSLIRHVNLSEAAKKTVRYYSKTFSNGKPRIHSFFLGKQKIEEFRHAHKFPENFTTKREKPIQIDRSPLPVKKKQTPVPAMNDIIRQFSRILGEDFREDTAFIDHDHKGFPLAEPVILKWSEVREETIDKQVFYVVSLQKGIRTMYDRKHFNLKGYKTDKGGFILYKDGQPLFLKRRPCILQRLTGLKEDTSPSDREIAVVVCELYNNLGEADAYLHLNRLGESEIKNKDIRERILSKRQDDFLINMRHALLRISISLYRTVEPNKIQNIHPPVFEDERTGLLECIYKILNVVTFYSKFLAKTDILIILDKSIPFQQTQTSIDKMDRLVAYSQNYHSPSLEKMTALKKDREEEVVVGEEKEGDESMTLHDLINDIDTEEAIFEEGDD